MYKRDTKYIAASKESWWKNKKIELDGTMWINNYNNFISYIKVRRALSLVKSVSFICPWRSWIAYAHALRFGAETWILSRLRGLFSILLLRDVVFLTAFLLQNDFQKFYTPPEYFRKLIFFLKTLEIGKCLRRQQNASVLNASSLLFSRISLNLKPHTFEPALLTAYLER